MTSSKLTAPLCVGIAGMVGFNLLPIVFGYGMTMNVLFMLYAGIMIVLSHFDRRVLGYATVLSACNPANYLANLSFSFLLATVTILKEFRSVRRVIPELGNHRWWWLFLASFLLIAPSVLFWNEDLRGLITEGKQALNRLGYLVVFPLAVGLTIRTTRDGVRAVSLLCLMSVVFLAVFYFRGQADQNYFYRHLPGGEEVSAFYCIGNICLNFLRTQVSILIAALAAVSFALWIAIGFDFRVLPFCLASGICVFMITLLASIGSAFSMVCGFGVVVLCYFGNRPRAGMILGAFLVVAMGFAIHWVVFRDESVLARRIQLKTTQIETAGIDRQSRWEQGVAEIVKLPFGQGWSTVGHSDWLLFFTYGWLPGFFYILAAGWLFMWMWLGLLRHMDSTDRQLRTLRLVGLAALSVYSVNAVLDMLSANYGYFQTVWALILTPAAVMIIVAPENWTKK
jgi:hypothetical protein